MSVIDRISTLWKAGRLQYAGFGREVAGGRAMACAICGRPARDWVYESYESNGARVIEGLAVCGFHHGSRASRAG
jgi:hypothetical protein